MIIIKEKKIIEYIKKNKLFYFFIFEKNDFFYYENDLIIIEKFNKLGFYNIKKIIINNNLDWINIHQLYQKNSFIFEKKILILKLINCDISNIIIDNIKNLQKKINYNFIIIFYFINVKNIKLLYEKFNKYFKKNTIFLMNNTNEITNIYIWIKYKILKLKLLITLKTLKYLIFYGKKNIYKISNLLNLISILYPNKIINSKILIKNMNLNDFKSFHWIKSIILRNKKKTLIIIDYFKKKNYEKYNLIIKFKIFLLTLIKIKEKKITEKKFSLKFSDKNEIFLNDINKYLEKEKLINIYLKMNLLKKIELNFKENKNKNFWIHLENLSL